ncbi:hypothetical protein CRYUN_Cryun16bG0075200 [Craigia yunnanensis]
MRKVELETLNLEYILSGPQCLLCFPTCLHSIKHSLRGVLDASNVINMIKDTKAAQEFIILHFPNFTMSEFYLITGLNGQFVIQTGMQMRICCFLR